MHGGFATLRHPATKASEIDVEFTRAYRAELRAVLARRQALLDELLRPEAVAIPDSLDEWVTPTGKGTT